MSVIVETRNKRILSKNDKIKKPSFNTSVYKNNDKIEFDGQINFKETNYYLEKEYISILTQDNARSLHTNNTNVIDISIYDVLKKIHSLSYCIIDLRDCRTHQNGHIKGALLFNCQKRMMVQRAKKSWDMFEEKLHFRSAIVYNQRGEDTSLVLDFIDYIKKDFRNVYFIKGGYEEFYNCADKELIESVIPEDIIDQHHYSLTNEATKSTDVLNATLSEILPYLYLGNELDSKDFDLLKRKKITHILNVTTTVPFSHEGHFIYKRLSATDCNKQNMRAYYHEAFTFIDKAKDEGGRVLVHCWAGVSRSATIVAAYLLKHTNINVQHTISFLRSKRSIVEPNFNFLGQLERFYCDLEHNIEPRILFSSVDDFVRKILELDRVKDLSLSSESSSSPSPISPPTSKPYFNFKK